MSSQSSVVYQEIQDTLREFFFGIKLCQLSMLERNYVLKFERSLDYQSLGVSNIEELIVDMGNMGMVVFFQNQEKEKYVMSAPVAELRRRVYLQQDVQDLLNTYRGEIEFDSFDALYKDKFKSELNYCYYGLTDLEHLCEIFKDILVVEEANSTGEKVIKRNCIEREMLTEREWTHYRTPP